MLSGSPDKWPELLYINKWTDLSGWPQEAAPLFFSKKSIYFDSGDQVRPIKIVLIVDSRPRIWTGCHGTSGGQKPARSKFKSFSGVRTRQTGEACHREESA